MADTADLTGLVDGWKGGWLDDFGVPMSSLSTKGQAAAQPLKRTLIIF